MVRTLSLVFLFLPFWAAGQVLFVDTQPMGAQIRIDDVLRVETTPARLTDVKPGPHRVTVGKPGYLSITQAVTLVDSVPGVVEVELPSLSVTLSFPQAERLNTPYLNLAAPGHQFRYPEGTYRIEGGPQGPVIVPAFPDDGLLAVAGWGLTLLATTAVASSALDVWHMNHGWTNHPSLATVGLWSATLFELPWYFALETRKAKFVRYTAPYVDVAPEVPSLSSETFGLAEDALAAGDLARAEALFAQVVADNPESRLVPGAWFWLARIHEATGRRELALGEYRLVVRLPQAAYYDRARQALALEGAAP